MAFSFLKSSVTEQTPDRTLAIWSYELAKVFTCLNTDRSIDGLVYARSELADVAAMALLFGEQVEHEACAKAVRTTPISSVQDGLNRLYEALGQVCQSYVHSEVLGAHSTKEPVNTALTCFYKELYLFCRFYNWDYYELLELGEKRYMDRMNDIREHGKAEVIKPK